MVLTAVLGLAAWVAAQEVQFDPHGSRETGALRVVTDPPTRGECIQCHEGHEDEVGRAPAATNLFTENTNRLAFWWQGATPCHQSRPSNYPLAENDRIPNTEPDAGYFEANTGGVRRPGVDFRGRWPGEVVFSNPRVTATGHNYSPHAHDPDMPRKDAAGEALCLNCHNPHGTANRRDILTGLYAGIAGHVATGAPAEYGLCLSCHGRSGPAGMDPENRRIDDFYDSGLNSASAGHQIRKNPAIALNWPAHIQIGDKLPCYDCHNPHGSEGNNRVQPNAFVLSDQRLGWSGLNDTMNNAEQGRRFCLGCHIPTDGIPGSRTVEGIVMNALPDHEAHKSTATQSCHDCHGRDYASATGHNVHNPGSGADLGGSEIGW
jgi:Doubled CXXCH motif (Paired_CXXCH_1)